MNVGGIDRYLRFAAGMALAAAPFLPSAAQRLVGRGAWTYANRLGNRDAWHSPVPFLPALRASGHKNLRSGGALRWS